MAEIASRRISPILGAFATEEPVIALHGPRAVGKSTVLEFFAASRVAPILDLDDTQVRDLVLANPIQAVGRTKPVCSDESERAPDVLDAIEDLLGGLRTDPDAAVAAHPTSETSRADDVARAVAGGFPMALRREGASRNRWLDNDATRSIERDAMVLSRVRQRQVLRDLLNRLAGRSGR